MDALQQDLGRTAASEPLVLRDYQRGALAELNDRLRIKRKQILCAPTGSGKTVMAAHLLNLARKAGRRAIFICDRIALVDQTAAQLRKFGIPHGILQGMREEATDSAIRVCSAQTLERRKFWPAADLVVIDEAHTVREQTRKFIADTGALVIGLTATPFTEGLADIYDGVVNTATTNDLIERGWIVPLRVYAAREIDMVGAKLTAGEWQAGEVERRGQAIVGDIVTEWVSRCNDHFGGPAQTLVFSATVPHGDSICQQFQQAGHDFRQVSYLDKDLRKRAELIEEFRRGEVRGLVSVDALAKGFDVPNVRVLIGARPYRKSLAAHIQQLGRVMRSCEGKEYGLVLDHAGNFAGFADETAAFFQRGINVLRKGKRAATVRKEKGERTALACDGCGLIFGPEDYCLGCGQAKPRRQSKVDVLQGGLHKFDFGGMVKRSQAKQVREQLKENKHWVWQQMCAEALRRRPDKAAAKKLALAQYKQLFDEWPKGKFDPASEPHEYIAQLMRKQSRAYFAKNHWNNRGE